LAASAHSARHESAGFDLFPAGVFGPFSAQAKVRAIQAELVCLVFHINESSEV
jgi:hypothetical protein